jgi:hypothetical protein
MNVEYRTPKYFIIQHWEEKNQDVRSKKQEKIVNVRSLSSPFYFIIQHWAFGVRY